MRRKNLSTKFMNKKKRKSKKGLIVVPARGGSKGIKNKNIVDVGGDPLILYTINPALKIKKDGLADGVIVSTDSLKIADIAKKLGADVPFLRPKKISGDKAKSIDFILHALYHFEERGVFFDYVVLLQPTSPLRSYEDIEGAIKLYMDSENDSLISVCREERVDETELYYNKKGIGIPLSPNHNKGIRRQDIRPMFTRNAAIYITATEYLKKERRIISDNPALYEMPIERSLDIDTKEDLKELRSILR
ncbi:MAG: CMP-N,N-diacetyllegionaminic acid synthase [Patescibacteria group bacterium]|nr:CMP-N,N-diacetyllegionaminic acid synthase [Patescibacteria group bacterium]